jgi:hypothetical protein
MRVLCIAKLEGVFGNDGPVPTPNIMEECIVTGQSYVPEFGPHLLYQLSGYPVNVGYTAFAFAILPEEDADEIQDAEHEAIIPNPSH